MIKIWDLFCLHCQRFLLRHVSGKLHLVASHKKKKKKITTFFVCTCFLDFYIYIYNSVKVETFNIHKYHCKLKTNLKFSLTYLGKNFVQVCHQFIFSIMLTKKLDLESVSRVLNFVCHHNHDDNQVVEYENCYIRLKTNEWDEKILVKCCWLCMKKLIFEFLFREFIVADSAHIVDNHV